MISNRSDKTSTTVEMSLATVETIERLYNGNSSKVCKKMDKNQMSQKRTLIMVLWVSAVFCTGRFVAAVANLILLFMQDTVYNWWATGMNFLLTAVVYASYFFVYMRTNKLFSKTFYKVFLKKRVQ